MPNIIHETVLKDIVDLIGDAKDFLGDGEKMLGKNKNEFKSLTRNANKLILVFPVLCTKGISIETASMITKAIEKYCVSLLQMLFASIQVNDTANLTDYISRFHSNISIGDKITVDDFVAFTDQLESAIQIGDLKVTDRVVYEQFQQGIKEFNNVIKTTVNEYALSNYACHRTYNGYETILEYIVTAGPDGPNGFNMYEDDYDDARDNFMKSKAQGDELKRQFRDQRRKSRESISSEEPITREERRKLNTTNRRLSKSPVVSEPINTRGVDRRDKFISRLAENDVKKANELMPTKVMVDFYSTDAGEKLESAIIGVKCKLYTVDSLELIERIATKYADTNWVRELVRASTGEISFWRDFVFALDRARVDALNASKKSSSAKMWKVLERRATKNRLSKWKANRADSSPITTLVVSQDEVEYLKKDYDINLENRKIAIKLMEAYNFMGLVIVDEPAEAASFIFDEGNDAQYETMSFRNLERESDDKNYRKVINLMTKISR